MNASQIYLVVSTVTLVVIVVLLLLNRRRDKRITPLIGLAFVLVLAGTFFTEQRLIGYGLMALGIILAVVDMLVRAQANRR